MFLEVSLAKKVGKRIEVFFCHALLLMGDLMCTGIPLWKLYIINDYEYAIANLLLIVEVTGGLGDIVLSQTNRSRLSVKESSP